MLQNDPTYDPIALKRRLARRHGPEVAGRAFDDEVAKRTPQVARAAVLAAEVASLDAEMSRLRQAHSEGLALSQSESNAVYDRHLALCDAQAKADSAHHSEILVLQARSFQAQQELRGIVLPWVNERESERNANPASTVAGILGDVGKSLPDNHRPPITEMEKINMSRRESPHT